MSYIENELISLKNDSKTDMSSKLRYTFIYNVHHFKCGQSHFQNYNEQKSDRESC